MLTKFTALAMGVLLSVSALAADMTAADMATLTRQAQSGDAAAQSDLAYEYYEQGNHAKAFEWFTKAAHQGHANAQYALGVLYKNGQGVHQDYQKAVEWYTKAANQGNADAQHGLGVLYEKGQGVRQDYQKAVEWYTKAANQGHADAQKNLGWMYYNGHGVRQDKSTAKRYYRQACDHGEQLGCDNYRILNEQGY